MSDPSSQQRLAASLRTVGKYAFWIVGLAVIVGGSYLFYNKMERPIAGVLFFMAGVLALYFYYVKWFLASEANPTWPPYQTPCPDYLTLMPDGSGAGASTGSYKCYDFVGVSRNCRLKKCDIRLFDKQKNNPDYYFMVNKNESQSSLQQRVIAYGLTWNSLFGDA